MDAHELNTALAELLDENPNVIAAWITSHSHAQTLRMLTDHHHVPGHLAVSVGDKYIAIAVPPQLAGLPYDIQRAEPFHDLRCPAPTGTPLNQHQECQNEPVQLGTQIQPDGAPWVGTAGLPVKWHRDGNEPAWGFLSNWHVMSGGPIRKGHPQHQPTDRFGVLGHLADWTQVSDTGVNYLDAAIANAYVDGFHTIGDKLIGIGLPSGKLGDAVVGLSVIKSGRTSQVTRAHCSAIGAAVKVSYGDFTATFADQDVFESEEFPFSEPGDSGSCILSHACLCPTALLFAGGGNLTIGNPIRYAVQRFHLLFPFN